MVWVPEMQQSHELLLVRCATPETAMRHAIIPEDNIPQHVVDACVRNLTSVIDALASLKAEHSDIKMRFAFDVVHYRFMACSSTTKCLPLVFNRDPEYAKTRGLGVRKWGVRLPAFHATLREVREECLYLLRLYEPKVNILYPEEQQWCTYYRYPWKFLAPEEAKTLRHREDLGMHFDY